MASAARVATGRARSGRPVSTVDPWMVSPVVDLLLFVGVTALTAIPWLIADVLHYPGYYALVAVAIANGPHLISTWTRVYIPRGERFRRPFHYWVIPGAVFAFAMTCELVGGLGRTLVRSTIFYWASWHFVAQSWGILRLYQRKHGVIGTTEATLERALIFLPALFCVLRRLFTGPWELFGVTILFQQPPAWLVNATGAVVVALAVVYLGLWVTRRRRPAGHELIRPVYLLFNFAGFAMPYLVIRDGTAAFAAAAFWHAVQYIAIVWLYNRRRYAGRRDPEAPLLSWASQPGVGRTFAYVAIIAACAAGVYTVAFIVARLSGVRFETMAMMFWTGLTLGHYYLDGVIWKFKRYDLKTLTAPAALNAG